MSTKKTTTNTNTGSFPAVFDVSHLNGKNGLLTSSETKHRQSSTKLLDRHSGFPLKGIADFDLSNLNQTTGMTMIGGYGAGSVVSSVGDFNGDGRLDLLVSSSDRPTIGMLYVVYGSALFPETLDLSSLNGSNGFAIVGPNSLGYSASSAGDFNNDGKDDLIMSGEGISAYMIYGSINMPAIFNVSLIDGENGFTMISDISPYAVSYAGDMNGDKKSDVIVSTSASSGGTGYVLYGTDAMPAIFNLDSVNGTNGFSILSDYDYTGNSVGFATDFNGDGLSDVMMSAGDIWQSGWTFVIYGAKNMPASILVSSLNGSNGFIINGIDGTCQTGRLLASIDFNGDGYSDLVLMAQELPNSSTQGYVAVVYGTNNSMPSVLNLSDLNGDNGFLVYAT